EKFGEDGNTMVIGLQSDRFFDQGPYESYLKLVESIQSLDGIQTVLSVPGAIQLVRDKESRRLKVMPIPADGSQDGAQAQKEFSQLPFYQGLLWNPNTKTYLMAVRIDQQVLNSKNRDQLVTSVVDLAAVYGKDWDVEMH